jgi:glucose-6-phosphate 1-dehydrogenase
MFYLAVPPQLFPVIASGISRSGLIKKGNENERIVFEKPFGEDLLTAKKINEELWNYFEEKQIYRIDHYLGKEMIQNILIVRFANIVFEQAWDNLTIDSIIILAKETEGVLRRGNYYDKVGALKDMVQSHLMQMVALITMEKPKSFNSDDIKDEKVKVIKKLKINQENVLLGQYKGYLKANNITEESKTETFVYAKGCIDNKRWKNVPIHLITGKSLDEKKSEIIINFKNEDSSFAKSPNNKLIIRVAPEEGVNFIFNVKEAGLGEKVVSAKLDYCHACDSLGNTPEAYEKLLLDLVNKQNSLFTRWDEIESSWKIIDEIKQYNNDLYIYDNYQEIKEKILSRNEGLKNDL